jgi:hypothetical protein
MTRRQQAGPPRGGNVHARRRSTVVHPRAEVAARVAAMLADCTHRFVVVPRGTEADVARRLGRIHGQWVAFLDLGATHLLELRTAADLEPLASRGHVDVLVAVARDVPAPLLATVLGAVVDDESTVLVVGPSDTPPRSALLDDALALIDPVPNARRSA